MKRERKVQGGSRTDAVVLLCACKLRFHFGVSYRDGARRSRDGKLEMT